MLFPLVLRFRPTRYNSLLCAVSGLCYLHKEGSIQCLRQVIITAEKGKLLRSRQLPSQHVGFLQLHQLFPEGQKLQLTHTHTQCMNKLPSIMTFSI